MHYELNLLKWVASTQPYRLMDRRFRSLLIKMEKVLCLR